MSPAAKALGVIFSLGLLGPQLVALFSPFEDWPFTTAPMFAHYVGENTPRYRFRFVAIGLKHEEEIAIRNFGLSELRTMRHFFTRVYGAAEEASPFGYLGDDKRAWCERLARFFDALVTRAKATKPKTVARWRAIRLEVVRLPTARHGELARTVGHYELASRRFIPLPRQDPSAKYDPSDTSENTAGAREWL